MNDPKVDARIAEVRQALRNTQEEMRVAPKNQHWKYVEIVRSLNLELAELYQQQKIDK